MLTTAESSWEEKMQKVKKQDGQGSDAEPEVLRVATPCKSPSKRETQNGALHWLLKAAMPEWTAKELKSSKSKLATVGIEGCSDLEDALEEKGTLNQRLKDHNLKAFGAPTLTRMRNQLKTYRERERLQILLEERRRLDRERKVELPPSTDDDEEEIDSVNAADDTGSLCIVGTTAAEDLDQESGVSVEVPPSSNTNMEDGPEVIIEDGSQVLDTVGPSNGEGDLHQECKAAVSSIASTDASLKVADAATQALTASSTLSSDESPQMVGSAFVEGGPDILTGSSMPNDIANSDSTEDESADQEEASKNEDDEEF